MQSLSLAVEHYVTFQITRVLALFDELVVREFKMNAATKAMFSELNDRFLYETTTFLDLVFANHKLQVSEKVINARIEFETAFKTYRNCIRTAAEGAPENCPIGSFFSNVSPSIKDCLDLLFSQASKLVAESHTGDTEPKL